MGFGGASTLHCRYLGLAPAVVSGLHFAHTLARLNSSSSKSCSPSLRPAAHACSNGPIGPTARGPQLLVPLQQVLEARVLYSVAPAMGHNQEGHPECNKRVCAIVEGLQTAGLSPETRGKEVLRIDNYAPATQEAVARAHSLQYVKGLEKIMDKAAEEGLIHVEGSGPTYATCTSYQEAMMAAGASFGIIDSVVAASKQTAEPPVGFALVRPPGHHAVPAGPMGFCLFSNIAVAARYAQEVHGLQRIFIIDFDVHHGNGTNDIFYRDPNVYFLSTHQEGSYPGTGKMEEVGEKQGEGTTLNLPLPGGAGDVAMSVAFEEVIVPAARRFKPDIILVSAGYDAHVLDPLAGLQFTTGTYYRLSRDIKQLARELCQGRCLFFLEGGYNLKALSNSVAETIRAFLGDTSMSERVDNQAILYDEPLMAVRQAVNQIKALHSLQGIA